MDTLSNASSHSPARRRRRVHLSDLTIHLVEQYEAVMRHLLFWLQDETYYRQLWHRQLAGLAIFDAEALTVLQNLLREIDDASSQFPYGFDPSEEARAQRLTSRLHLLSSEVRHLQKLCGAYTARIARTPAAGN